MTHRRSKIARLPREIHGQVKSPKLLHRVAPCCTVLHRVALCCSVLRLKFFQKHCSTSTFPTGPARRKSGRDRLGLSMRACCATIHPILA